jgi:hypothetical protein
MFQGRADAEDGRPVLKRHPKLATSGKQALNEERSSKGIRVE